MSQDAAERFVANDLLVIIEGLVLIWPLTGERPILFRLVGTRLRGLGQDIEAIFSEPE